MTKSRGLVDARGRSAHVGSIGERLGPGARGQSRARGVGNAHVRTVVCGNDSIGRLVG
jgi:hypothetical protein